MNINANIRNKAKLVEKLRRYTYKSLCMPAAKYPRLQKLVPNKS